MIRLERRLESPRWLLMSLPLLSLLVALLIAGIVLAISGHNPFATYRAVVQASFTNSGAFSETLVSATPLVLTGLCAAVAFRMRIYNIGGEGQLYMGAVAASGAGLALGNQPPLLVITVMILAGTVGGSLWALIPGALRAYLGTNEILTTLMLNYVAGLFIYYLIFNSNSYWRDLTSLSAKVYPEGKTLSSSAWWPALHAGPVTFPMGFLLGIALAVGLQLILKFTGAGFQIRVLAGSQQAAHYAGMRTRRTILLVMVVSGGFAGLAGASQVGDFSHLLDPTGLQQVSYGYTGIVVAALVGFDPVATVLAALFLGALNNAGFSLQGATFPQGLVGTIEGIVLFCVLSSQVLVRYRVRKKLPAMRRTESGDVMPKIGDGEPHSSADSATVAGHQPGAVHE